MITKKSIFVVLFILIFVAQSYSQISDNWAIPTIDSVTTSNLAIEKNVLMNTNALNPLLAKLYKIKHFSNEKAVIVHLGDSHVQADMMTAEIRSCFQTYFGNAGRGLVFPFQVAKSNAPSDVISSSKNNWKGNRIAKADTLISCGISGFGLQSLQPYSDINLELRTINGRKETFDKVSFFMGGKVTEIQIEENENQVNDFCFENAQDFFTMNFKTLTSSFKLSFPTTDTIHFYGALLEKKEVGGVIYHSIGANGARYSDYNKTPLFWKQIKYLNADCYIISLGTNEAQDQNLTVDGFLEPVKIMVNRLKLVSPNAAIILTTPPVSYFKKTRPNPALEVIANAIIAYCNENNLVYWDLFNISKGLEGAKTWRSKQLLRPDLIHFSKEGYVLQGNLFVTAFAKVWNDFLSKN